MHLCLCIVRVCQVPGINQKRTSGHLELYLWMPCVLPCGDWDLNAGPLHEHWVLLTSEPSPGFHSPSSNGDLCWGNRLSCEAGWPLWYLSWGDCFCSPQTEGSKTSDPSFVNQWVYWGYIIIVWVTAVAVALKWPLHHTGEDSWKVSQGSFLSVHEATSLRSPLSLDIAHCSYNLGKGPVRTVPPGLPDPSRSECFNLELHSPV